MLLDDVPRRALAIFAHPDDPEVSCAGTLARWAAQGADVHLVISNAGDKGSSDPEMEPAMLARMRAQEADDAAKVLCLAGHEMLGYPDGEIENTLELRGALVRRIRTVQPDVLICPDPTASFFGDTYVNHHDHRVVGWAALDAAAPMAALPLYFPDVGGAHAVETLLLAGTLDPDGWVDIADHLDTKVAALRCHRSQLGQGENLVDEVVRSRASEAASSSGVRGIRYAEGFRRLRLSV